LIPTFVASTGTSVRLVPARWAKWLVALALLAVSLAFGVPLARDFAARTSVAAGADALLEAFHLARSEALVRKVSVTICKTANTQAPLPACAGSAAEWPQGWVVFVDQGTIGVVDAFDKVIARGRPLGAIDVEERPTRLASVTFNPVGPIAGPASTLEVHITSPLSRGSFERVICLSLLGRAHVSKSGGCQA